VARIPGVFNGRLECTGDVLAGLFPPDLPSSIPAIEKLRFVQAVVGRFGGYLVQRAVIGVLPGKDDEIRT
jgi:hypothetical protein